MDLTNQGAWYIRKMYNPETELELDLLDKIEDMESKIEELEEDLKDEKDAHNETDKNWEDRMGDVMKEHDSDIKELEARIEELELSLDSYEAE